MIISKDTIKRIKEIIDRKYTQLSLSILGKSIVSPKDLQLMTQLGLDTSNDISLLELIYNHHFINLITDNKKPTSVEAMITQQSIPGRLPTGEAAEYAIEHANEKVAQSLEKMKVDVSTRIESLIRDTNNQYKANALQNLKRTDEADQLIKEGMVGQIKQRLRDASGDANRDWTRVAITEVSNTMGIASTDQIVARNIDKDLKEVYVFKIPVNDSKLCVFCRKFYLDADDSPKLYRLSTLLSNGSNYGKKTAEWKATITATHPNDRESQVIELPPGYKLLPGGQLTYIGLEDWTKYVLSKLQS